MAAEMKESAGMQAADGSSWDRSTHRLGVEVEQRRAEVLGALAGYLGGARPVVGQRHVVERRHSRRGCRRLGRRGEPGEPPRQIPRPLPHHRHAPASICRIIQRNYRLIPPLGPPPPQITSTNRD
jgi:hypothetical protein